MCVLKGRSSDCAYTPKITKRPGQHRFRPVQDRASDLDSAIGSLAERQEMAQPPCTSSPDGEFQSTEGSVGRIRTQQGETNYVGAEHWAAIADDQPQNDRSPDLLMGMRSAVTLEELLHAVPSRTVVDRLISRYFNTMDFFAFQYNCFWEDPSSVSLNWLSILYSMMSIASCHSSFSSDPRDGTSQSREDISFFRHRSAQCLVLSDYTKPTVNTVEALLLYFFGQHIERQKNQFANYLVFTTVVRVAMRAGYHRDSLHFQGISAFTGEYRRRVWLVLLQFDIIMSFEVGLPRTINEVETDTELPRILRDGDLTPEMSQLPPSRPEDDSVLCHIIVRVGKLRVLGKIQDRAVSIHPLSYDIVIQIDQSLDEQYDSVPPSFKAHHRYAITETPTSLLQRLMIDLLFQKARCSLHRRFIHSQPKSHRKCIDASLRIIHHQSYIYHECRPGGFLWGYKWKVISAASYDFLLAAIIICLGVTPQNGSGQNGPPCVDPDSYGGPGKLLKALEESYMIWTEWSSELHEARVVSDIVKSVLKRVKGQRTMVPFDNNDKTVGTTCLSDSSAAANNDLPLDTAIDMENFSPLSTDIFADIIDLNGGIDWTQWDNQMQQQGINPHLQANSQMWFTN
ncbi:hypothetical protein N7465_010834 [Penicillium sp. CMV-2018d]|nr:hypothetical protein N7465_010834 [Penicillium sp. CMV-2018d]